MKRGGVVNGVLALHSTRNGRQLCNSELWLHVFRQRVSQQDRTSPDLLLVAGFASRLHPGARHVNGLPYVAHV